MGAMREHFSCTHTSIILICILIGKAVSQEQNLPPDLEVLDRNSEAFLDRLILGCTDQSDSACRFTPPPYRYVEYEGYDGWYNNQATPSQGAIDTPLLRILPPVYDDGVYQPVKRDVNPLDASSRLMNGSSGRSSNSGLTAFMVYFGQQVVEEIMDSQRPACPPEYILTPIPSDHEYNKGNPGLRIFPSLRTRFDMTTGFSPNNPRQQLNEITPYIDGTLIYGAAKGWADVLRSFRNGSIAPRGQLAWHSQLGMGFPEENEHRMPFANPPPPTRHGEYVERGFTENVDRFFKLGNVRGNENPFLLTFGIFWFRWHNRVARYLDRKYGSAWDGERLFNEARKWVIATQQAITLYDWLPKYLQANTDPYNAYDPAVNPQISHAFQTAAMRYGHTLVTSGVYLRNKNTVNNCSTVPFTFFPSDNHQSNGVRTCNSFWRSPELFQEDPDNFERFLLGLSSQSAEREDNIIVDDIRLRLFGPLEFSRRDLMALNIIRARDHGLPDYNTARALFGLPRISNYSSFISQTGSLVDQTIINAAMELYDHPNNTDIWVGGLLETAQKPGQLFTAIMKTQFERIRNGDRFWFENQHNGLFTLAQIEALRSLTIFEMVSAVANITGEDMQNDPFTAPRTNNNVGGSFCRARLTNTISCNIFDSGRGDFASSSCSYLPPLSDTVLENCTDPQTYDYFTGSSISFILTFFFTGLFGVVTIIGVKFWSVAKLKKKQHRETSSIKATKGSYRCKERVSTFESRVVILQFDLENRRILVKDNFGKILRGIELLYLNNLTLKMTPDSKRMVIRVKNHYDLYLKFSDKFMAKQMIDQLSEFCTSLEVTKTEVQESMVELHKNLITVKEREKQLAKFTSFVLGKTFKENVDVSEAMELLEKKDDFLKLNLTRNELASALGMDINSIFVTQLFLLMDSDGSGFISIKEFFELMLIFSKGTIDDKAALFFNIYDLDHSGMLSADDFTKFVESTLGSGSKGDVSKITKTIIESIGLGDGKDMDFEQFLKIFKEQDLLLKNISIDVEEESKKKGSRFSIYGNFPMKGQNTPQQEVVNEDHTKFAKEIKQPSMYNDYWRQFSGFVLSKQTIIFWRVLYTVVMLLIFIERAYFFSVEREHAGLRRIAGYGVTVTRGAASAMMFTYSTLLVTMAKNLLSALRSTPLHKYFPFDDMVEMHKYIGWWALVWTVVHIIGHAINFYHISTQTPGDLACIFRDFFRSTHIIPKFHYWCWETITGLTGVFLTLHVIIIYAFAIYARRHIFKFFWYTHNTYPIFYLLMILHGSGNLVQPPYFHYFFLAPVILFTIDKLVSISRNSIQINVVKAVHLPSEVILLYIQRPRNYTFLSGQWIRIASLAISAQEFHPFTLSSAPYEKYLTLHIRSVGPWTNQLRKVYPDYESVKNNSNYKYPKIFVDGPFGEGHQGWWAYDVVVFVGGGIGVTPFASILKDIIYKTKQPMSTFKCKKVIFLWVTRDQRQFEWLADILRFVETSDTRDIIRNHIFITQFKSKYDLRTIMLYMAERHFQKICGKSLFTGLKAITHFSRPDFPEVFRSIKEQYNTNSLIAVFTCGNPSLSTSVEHGCREANKNEGPVLKHYYENF